MSWEAQVVAWYHKRQIRCSLARAREMLEAGNAAGLSSAYMVGLIREGRAKVLTVVQDGR